MGNNFLIYFYRVAKGAGTVWKAKKAGKKGFLREGLKKKQGNNIFSLVLGWEVGFFYEKVLTWLTHEMINYLFVDGNYIMNVEMTQASFNF